MGRYPCREYDFSCGNVPEKDWEILGGYDESLLTGLEDYAFWLRLIALGREVVQLDEVLFITGSGQDPGRLLLPAGNSR